MDQPNKGQITEAQRLLIARLFSSEKGWQVEFTDTMVIITNPEVPGFRKEIPNQDLDLHLRHGIRISSAE